MEKRCGADQTHLSSKRLAQVDQNLHICPQHSISESIEMLVFIQLSGKALGLAIDRSRVQILLEVTLRNNLWQVVYTYVPVTKQYNLVPAKGRWCSEAGEVTAGLQAESNGSLPPGGWLTVTCGLTACTPGSAPGPTLGIEFGKPLPFLPFIVNCFSNILQQTTTL